MASIRINGPFGSFEMPISGKKDPTSRVEKVDNDKIVKERKEKDSKDHKSNSNESFDKKESKERKENDLSPNKKLNAYLSGQSFCPTYTKDGSLEKEEPSSSFDISI